MWGKPQLPMTVLKKYLSAPAQEGNDDFCVNDKKARRSRGNRLGFARYEEERLKQRATLPTFRIVLQGIALPKISHSWVLYTSIF